MFSEQKPGFKMVHDGNDEIKQAPEDMCSDIEMRMTFWNRF